MSNKDYYAMWLKLKEEFQLTLLEDQRLQEFAINYVGIKPQSTAVEIVARVYCKYCDIYNRLCECYDQMQQVQRRPFIKKIIDALTCRIMELKATLELVEAFELTYTDNACQQLLIKPTDVDILCPFFYPFEIRQLELQEIMDQIFAGNRIGDPTPTPSEIERREEERLEEEKLQQELHEAEMRRRIALGLELEDEVCVELTPAEVEANRLKEEYETNIFNIQRMERSRIVCRELAHKKLKDENLVLELSGTKNPPAKEILRFKAAKMLAVFFRMFMDIKRIHQRENSLKEKLEMIIPSVKQVSAKVQLEKVREIRRNFRRTYYEKWLAARLEEKARVLRLKEGDIMEDISDEIRQWFFEWFGEVRVFDEFPFPEEGGTILVVKGETQTIEEYIQWKDKEEKRIKAESGQKKTKEQIKAEKKFEREERKRIALEAKEKEKKRIADYKKSRFNPDNDPGVYLTIGNNVQALETAWMDYQSQWKNIDEPGADLDVVRGYITQLITETAFQEAHIELRPIVDEAMRLELDILKRAMKKDYASAELPVPMTLKRKKPKKAKPPKVDKARPQILFQRLADQGIVRKYPLITLDDYWGERNYAAADCRAIQWTPTFPPPCIGDIKEQVRIRCLLALGSNCPNAQRSQLIVGPKGTGKKTLVYAVATETNSLLIDLSPLKIYNKFPGRETKHLWSYVNKVSRMMQPTIILIENVDKMFYKKVPKEEKEFDPTRFQKDLFKELIKPLGAGDRVLVIGTATEPWLATNAKMFKAFPSTILMPRTDYATVSYILKKMLMTYHGVDREFNVSSLAQVLRGYSVQGIMEAVDKILSSKRLAELKYKPLQPAEILQGVLYGENTVYMDEYDYDMFQQWYWSYSPFGVRYNEYMLMLEAQWAFKLKNEKKKK